MAQEQKEQVKENGESITLWLLPSVIADLNELVGWKTNRTVMSSRSSVVTELIRREHQRLRRVKG